MWLYYSNEQLALAMLARNTKKNLSKHYTHELVTAGSKRLLTAGFQRSLVRVDGQTVIIFQSLPI